MLKVCVIGGASTYTPELVNGFLTRLAEFPLTELWLMDIDLPRLEVVGRFAQRMVYQSGTPFRVFLTTNLRDAVEASDYVITQFRVGQMEARRRDEYLGRRHGLIGQETTGVGGMAKALRTIPVVLHIAETMQVLAKPGACLVNFTNPAGLITQALTQYTPGTLSIGVCNSPFHAKINLLETLMNTTGERIMPERAELDTLGLNHLSWHRGLRVDGEDVWEKVMLGFIKELQTSVMPDWDVHTIETLRMIPNDYLQYFYYTEKKLAEQDRWPPSRAEVVMEVEKTLLTRYADPGLKSMPGELMQRGGAYYSTVAAQLMNAHYNDLGEKHVVNIRNGGAVPGWPENWVLEMPASVSRQDIAPLPADPLPPVCFGLVAAVKSYELLTIEAAVRGDREAAYQALLVHPLGPPADRVQAFLDDLLETHRDHLPVFWN